MPAGHARRGGVILAAPMHGSMFLPARGIDGAAADETHGASGRMELLETTDVETKVGCRQHREARSR